LKWFVVIYHLSCIAMDAAEDHHIVPAPTAPGSRARHALTAESRPFERMLLRAILDVGARLDPTHREGSQQIVGEEPLRLAAKSVATLFRLDLDADVEGR
jgi:hypothetical protein